MYMNTAEETKNQGLMQTLLDESPAPPSVGDIVEGNVIGIDKAAVYVDFHPFGTGIIYGREFLNSRAMLRKINVGDEIQGKVVSLDHEDGYIEISLKEARQAIIWEEAEAAVREKTVLELPVTDANKGGLLITWQGIQGFLPASQLKTEHYPRVPDGDKDKILEELNKLIGEKLAVSIIGADPKEGKLIFSEKDPQEKDKGEIVDRYELGDVIKGEVTGAVDFGVFIKITEGLEGLVHISELDWSLVEDPRKLYRQGDKVEAKIIEIKDGKISLSIKALKPNPWAEAGKKYKKGDKVDGVIIKFNKHGALASIEEGVAGLVHISEFENEEELHKTLELGKVYPFGITLFEPNEQKMTLAYAGKKEE